MVKFFSIVILFILLFVISSCKSNDGYDKESLLIYYYQTWHHGEYNYLYLFKDGRFVFYNSRGGFVVDSCDVYEGKLRENDFNGVLEWTQKFDLNNISYPLGYSSIFAVTSGKNTKQIIVGDTSFWDKFKYYFEPNRSKIVEEIPCGEYDFDSFVKDLDIFGHLSSFVDFSLKINKMSLDRLYGGGNYLTYAVFIDSGTYLASITDLDKQYIGFKNFNFTDLNWRPIDNEKMLEAINGSKYFYIFVLAEYYDDKSEEELFYIDQTSYYF